MQLNTSKYFRVSHELTLDILQSHAHRTVNIDHLGEAVNQNHFTNVGITMLSDKQKQCLFKHYCHCKINRSIKKMLWQNQVLAALW